MCRDKLTVLFSKSVTYRRASSTDLVCLEDWRYTLGYLSLNDSESGARRMCDLNLAVSSHETDELYLTVKLRFRELLQSVLVARCP